MLEGIPVDRARQRWTLTYAVNERLSLGVEWNPLDDDVGPLANYRVLDETETRPALILGTSSDRIGTPSGRAYYATLSKDVERWTGLPVAPYVGTAFGEFDDDWELIAGLRIRLGDRLSTTSTWDGENLHHVADFQVTPSFRLGAVVAEQDGEHFAGFTTGVSF